MPARLTCWCCLLCLIAQVAWTATADEAAYDARSHGVFSEVSPATIQAEGWLKSWLQLQVDGLTGQPQNSASPYAGKLWTGMPMRNPKGPYWWAFEQTAYLVDAMARMRHIGPVSPGMEQGVKAAYDHIVTNSTPDSVAGCTGRNFLWPVAVIARMLYAEDMATGKTDGIDLLRRIYRAQRDRIAIGASEGVEADGTREGVNMEMAGMIYLQTGDPEMLKLVTMTGPTYFEVPVAGHGVTLCEILKLLPVYYLCSGDGGALERAIAKYEELHTTYAMSDGVIVSSEILRPLAFGSLHETCDVTDYTWSLGYMIMATGDARYADRIERVVLNGLPGCVSKDFRGAQYYSACNQVIATADSSHGSHSSSRMSYRAAHDTACCIGNVSRCMPNYVCRMYLRREGGGYAAMLYGPSVFRPTVDGQVVTIRQETDYPFSDTIRFTFQCKTPAAFPFSVRIPAWCEAPRVTHNGTAVPARPGSMVTAGTSFKHGDVVELTLPMRVRKHVPPQMPNTCHLTYGPLTLALPVKARERTYVEETEEISKQLRGRVPTGFPAREFKPEGEWRYALDPALDPATVTVTRRAMPANPWTVATAPYRFTLPATRITQGWDLEYIPRRYLGRKTYVTPRYIPSPDTARYAAEPETIELVPYGATYLRLTDFPVK